MHLSCYSHSDVQRTEATISNKTTTDINAVARAICSFNMKNFDALTIVTTILVLGILGGGFKYASEQFKAKMMNQVLDNVKGLMPDVLGKSLWKHQNKFNISNKSKK